MSLNAEEVEAGYLSCCMQEPECIDRGIAAGVTADTFKHPHHHHLWRLLCELRLAGSGTGAIAVVSVAVQRGLAEKLGGIPLLLELDRRVTMPSSAAGPLLAALLDLGAKREVWTRLTRAVETLKSGAGSLDDIRPLVQGAADLCAGQSGPVSRTLAEVDAEVDAELKAEETGANKEGLIGWGLPKLDRFLKPIRRNEYVLICARPSRGKTSMLCHLTNTAIDAEQRVAYFQLEDDTAAILKKLSAQRAKVCYGEWTALLPEHRRRFMAAKKAIVDSGRLLVFDRDLTLEAIQSRCAMLAQSFKPHLVVIDYLGQIRVPGGSLYERVSAVSKAMIPLRKVLGCALVAGQQLKRLDPDDREPTLADLRDSGQLEEDAVRVNMLHWKDSRLLDATHRDYLVTQPKYRFGPTTAVQGIMFHSETTTFYEPGSTVSSNP